MKVRDEVPPMTTEEPMSTLKQMSIQAASPVSGGAAAPPAKPARRGEPRRGVERYNSGGQLRMFPRRAPPKRSQSHRIGRPAFSKDPPATDSLPRAVSRNSNKNFTRAAPLRTGSYTRAVPDRSSSTSSLRAYRRQQHSTPLGQAAVIQTPLGQQIEIPYSQRGGDGDDASVFTTASNQTLDSIMLRKKQIDGNGVPVAAAAMKRERPQLANTASFEFDESLHTVDSIKVHMRHVHEVLDEDHLSVFSESFASTETYMLSDYEEDEEEDDDDDDDDDDEEDDDEEEEDDDDEEDDEDDGKIEEEVQETE